MESLSGITGRQVIDATSHELSPARKSAGLAWLFSSLVPGTGHLYTGLYLRGGLVLGLSLAGVLVVIRNVASRGADIAATLGTATYGLVLLWVFGFLDAYLTAAERNRGIDPGVVDNPRVAAILNLTTRGFGYFYLGERVKGVLLFVGLALLSLLAGALPGRAGIAVSALTEVALVAIAIDAYRIGRRSFDAQVATMDLPPPPPPSRVPPIVPYSVAGLALFVLASFFLLGVVMMLFFTPQMPA